MKPKGIFLSWIVVKDIKSAIEFYTKTIGLELQEFHEEFGWAELSGPEGARLGIACECPENGDVKAGDNAVVSICVDDIQVAKEELKKKGVKLIGDVLDVDVVKLQTFCDIDGNTFQLAEIVK
jgi:predicted enzyme related to lactoylglutathione lyase